MSTRRAGGEQTAPGPLPSAKPSVARGDLVLAIGSGVVLSHEVRTDSVSIGRDPTCDFVIGHVSLSRRHAVLRVGSPCSVQDLGSTNGTRIGERVIKGGEPITLIGRAQFEIGPFMFFVVDRKTATESRLSRDPLEITDPTVAGATRTLREIASTNANVLIVGETGVGKEVLASTVHELSGRDGVFVQVNCAALSESLLESELFGHERGAFTGAQAQKQGLIEVAANGTLLLDEIGDVPAATQAKLLRVIERREVLRIGAVRPIAVDVRFIAATNRDLVAEVDRGTFRADLYYRLDGITLAIPPLRERRGAIAPLALTFLAAIGRPAQLSADVIAALEAHSWRGNVRELKAVIERAAVLAGTGEIAVKHLVFARSAAARAEAVAARAEVATSSDDADRQRVIDALEQCAGNQSRAARLLGISRTSLITKLRLYKIPRPHDRPEGS